MQHYLGFYDISSSTLRASVFKLLAAYGVHQQKSVFVCYLSQRALECLIEQLQYLTQNQICRIGFLQIYLDDLRNFSLGTKPVSDNAGFLYVG